MTDSIIKALFEAGGNASTSEVGELLGITRQTARKYLAQLVEEGLVTKSGRARATRYRFVPLDLRLDPQGLEEDRVWSRKVRPWVDKLGGVTPESRGRAAHCVTELLNNAIDHAGGSEINLRAALEGGMLCFVIEDDGIGAYRKLMQDFEFDSAAHAIQALQAGKLTSDPTNHAGEGIFFSSKMAAEFALESAGKRWKVNAVEETAAIEASLVTTGTRVSFTIDPRGTEPSGVVFDRYTTGEDNDHTRTRIVVHLYEFGGEELRARSAAKRLAASVEPYAEAVLDFKGVEELGQGFADQLFVVFAREHPETELIPINTNPSVDAMIRYVRKRLVRPPTTPR